MLHSRSKELGLWGSPPLGQATFCGVIEGYHGIHPKSVEPMDHCLHVHKHNPQHSTNQLQCKKKAHARHAHGCRGHAPGTTHTVNTDAATATTEAMAGLADGSRTAPDAGTKAQGGTSLGEAAGRGEKCDIAGVELPMVWDTC